MLTRRDESQRRGGQSATTQAFVNWVIVPVSKMTSQIHMGRARNRPTVTLTSDQRSLLERWVRARTTPQRVVLRSTIVLLASQGLATAAIAKRVGSSRETVRLWCERFREAGPPVLLRDRPGRGRKPHITASAIAKARSETTGTRLSIRQLARRLGTSSSAVYRALAAQRPQRQFRNGDDEA